MNVYSRTQEQVIFSCEYVRDISISQEHDVIRYTHNRHLEHGVWPLPCFVEKYGKSVTCEQ
jgi:hypothetical protein